MRNECGTTEEHHPSGGTIEQSQLTTSTTVMIAETISLGILSLPSAMATLGLVP